MEPSKIVVLPLSGMKKVSRKIDRNGRVLEEDVTHPGQDRFAAIKEKRKQRLGL